MFQCVNPACRKTIVAPDDGRALEFEVVSVSVAVSDEDSHSWDETPKREAKRVYLCPECAGSFSVTIGPQGISVQPARR